MKMWDITETKDITRWIEGIWDLNLVLKKFLFPSSEVQEDNKYSFPPKKESQEK